MNCEICDRANAENVGIVCSGHRVCMLCIGKMVKKAVNAKKNVGLALRGCC